MFNRRNNFQRGNYYNNQRNNYQYNNYYGDGYNNYNSYNDYNNYNVNNTITQGYEFSRYITKVYMWMFTGLAITFGLAMYMTVNSNSLADFILDNYGMYLISVILSLAFVIVIGFIVPKLPPLVAKIIFIVYSADIGVLITPTLLIYSLKSVISVFGITSVIYLLLAIIGIKTKKDMSKLGYISGISLLVVMIYSLVSYFFIHSKINDIVINIVVTAIFIGFTIFDNFKIKKQFIQIYNTGNTSLLEKSSIISALSLYLDYVNLFVRFLSLFGKRRD